MEYEVGKYYKVVCMEVKYRYIKCDNLFVPILGLHHKDPQFGADIMHYHIDGRFANRKIQKVYEIVGGKTNCVVFDKNLKSKLIPVKKVVKTLKCKREETGLLTHHLSRTYSTYWSWYKTMVGKSCKGKRCPHLGTEMFERNGQLICPLHNLVGDIKKEIIINQ